MNICDIISNIYPMPKASIDKLIVNLSEVAYTKGHHILEAGKNERNIFFVKKGIVRAYIPVNGRDITFWIGLEGSTVMSLKSYVNNEKGYETVECLEDTVLYVLKRDVIEALFLEDIHIANWGRKLAEFEFLQAEEKFIPLLFASATERYKALLKDNPHLLQRISLQHLASYLGITPVSLSRIRANINKK